MKALTIRQPWAWLIMEGTKTIENRAWSSFYKGELAIHAAKGMTRAEYVDALDFVYSFDRELAVRIPEPSALVRGAVIGIVTMVECVASHPSPFFQGPYGFVFKNQRLLPDPIPAKGSLGIWTWSQFDQLRKEMR